MKVESPDKMEESEEFDYIEVARQYVVDTPELSPWQGDVSPEDPMQLRVQSEHTGLIRRLLSEL